MTERNWQKDWELCEKATSGPWKADREGTHFVEYYITVNKGFKERVLFSGDNELDTTWEDTVFVAEAREALPYWLRRYKELHAKWFADVEEKIRLRYTNQQLQEELVRLKGIILQFARYADDHKVVLVCPEEASECNSLCSACWQAALDGRKEGEEG